MKVPRILNMILSVSVTIWSVILLILILSYRKSIRYSHKMNLRIVNNKVMINQKMVSNKVMISQKMVNNKVMINQKMVNNKVMIKQKINQRVK